MIYIVVTGKMRNCQVNMENEVKGKEYKIGVYVCQRILCIYKVLNVAHANASPKIFLIEF